jgi:hypothetical protein
VTAIFNVALVGTSTDAMQLVVLLANEFAGKIPELEFSPAEIRPCLLENSDSPCAAVENVANWMARIRKERKVTKSDSWVLNVCPHNSGTETTRGNENLD